MEVFTCFLGNKNRQIYCFFKENIFLGNFFGSVTFFEVNYFRESFFLRFL